MSEITVNAEKQLQVLKIPIDFDNNKMQNCSLGKDFNNEQNIIQTDNFFKAPCDSITIKDMEPDSTKDVVQPSQSNRYNDDGTINVFSTSQTTSNETKKEQAAILQDASSLTYPDILQTPSEELKAGVDNRSDQEKATLVKENDNTLQTPTGEAGSGDEPDQEKAILLKENEEDIKVSITNVNFLLTDFNLQSTTTVEPCLSDNNQISVVTTTEVLGAVYEKAVDYNSNMSDKSLSCNCEFKDNATANVSIEQFNPATVIADDLANATVDGSDTGMNNSFNSNISNSKLFEVKTDCSNFQNILVSTNQITDNLESFISSSETKSSTKKRRSSFGENDLPNRLVKLPKVSSEIGIRLLNPNDSQFLSCNTKIEDYVPFIPTDFSDNQKPHKKSIELENSTITLSDLRDLENENFNEKLEPDKTIINSQLPNSIHCNESDEFTSDDLSSFENLTSYTNFISEKKDKVYMPTANVRYTEPIDVHINIESNDETQQAVFVTDYKNEPLILNEQNDINPKNNVSECLLKPRTTKHCSKVALENTSDSQVKKDDSTIDNHLQLAKCSKTSGVVSMKRRLSNVDDKENQVTKKIKSDSQDGYLYSISSDKAKKLIKDFMDANELADINDKRWSLYDFSNPQDSFDCVANQWSYEHLPNPHENLTLRFYDQIPPFPTNASRIPGDSINHYIPSTCVYTDQLDKINRKIDQLKFLLDRFGSSWKKRKFAKTRNQLNELYSRYDKMYKAYQESAHFYKYYSDARTRYNNNDMSEFHRNEAKHYLAIINSFENFYGVTD